MMMHPAAVKTVRDVIKRLVGGRGKGGPELVSDWVTVKL